MLSLILALALADPPAQPAATPAEPPAATAKPADGRPPADISKAVDANGVPAWAKRKRKEPVQACPTKPNIGVETWRERYENTGTNQLKPRPDMNTCR
ncbi:MAG: hypothetical protein DI570_22950 [Phenylobacterium zucineum]|nr:MAG: hypothetical protein DI570_22950 [Phenylobacterium zucineum]